MLNFAALLIEEEVGNAQRRHDTIKLIKYVLEPSHVKNQNTQFMNVNEARIEYQDAVTPFQVSYFTYDTVFSTNTLSG